MIDQPDAVRTMSRLSAKRQSQKMRRLQSCSRHKDGSYGQALPPENITHEVSRASTTVQVFCTAAVSHPIASLPEMHFLAGQADCSSIARQETAPQTVILQYKRCSSVSLGPINYYHVTSRDQILNGLRVNA